MTCGRRLEIAAIGSKLSSNFDVKLLGCDYGYYDLYVLFPPTPSWQTEVTPFNCVECECEDFEHERVEQFVSA